MNVTPSRAEGVRKANETKARKWRDLVANPDAFRDMLIIEQAIMRRGGSYAAQADALTDFARRFGVTHWYVKRFRFHVLLRHLDLCRMVDAVADPVIEGPVMAAFTHQVTAMEALADALERGDPPSVWRHHADVAFQHAEVGEALFKLVQGHSRFMLSVDDLSDFPRDPMAVALLRRMKAVCERIGEWDKWADGWGGDGGEPLPV
jgi:hypothetical protein